MIDDHPTTIGFTIACWTLALVGYLAQHLL